MAWRDALEDWTARLNPYLTRVAVGLAMVVVLMAYGERHGSIRPGPVQLLNLTAPDEPGVWRTD